MHSDAHIDEKQERLREKLRDELGPVIVGLLDKSSGLEDIIVNEDSRDPNPARKAAYIRRTMAKARLWANR